MSKKQYETEWSFSFEKIAEQISNTVNQAVSGFKDDSPAQMNSYSEAINGATSAEITLGFAAGANTINALNASENLLEADLTYYGEVEFEVEGTTERKIRLAQTNMRFGRIVNAGKRKDMRWDVRLSPDVPLALDITAPVGSNHFDLSELMLTELTYKGGVGEHLITLAQSPAPYHAKIDSGVGETRITIPENTSVQLHLRGGVGETTVIIPRGTAIHLSASHGLGDINVPQGLEQLSGNGWVVGKNGVWQSENYADAPYKVTLHYQGGVGAFNLVIA